jgi:DNA-binding NarL/FixJ family response regulator
VNILIVDDEDMIRESLHAFLEAKGCSVECAGSAEAGLAGLENNQPDVAIVDIRLPCKNGNQFILEANEKLPRLKFLIFTGSADYALPLELRWIGLCKEHVFQKPLVDLTELFEAALRCAGIDGKNPR